MNKNLILVGAVVAGLAGCGQSGSSEASSTTSTVSGTTAADSTSVALRDSSSPAHELSAVPADGAYAFDVTGLTPPFALRAQGRDGTQYTLVTRSGNADVNELTSAAVAGATRMMGEDDGGDGEGAWTGGTRDAAEHMGAVLRGLRTVLKPLFDLYGVTRIGGDDDGGDPSGMRALLRDVSFVVKNGTLTVSNRATGGVIYAAPLASITSGTFHPENMPAGPGTTPPPPATCTYGYSAWGTCQNGSQTRTVVSATPAGCTGTPMLSQACTVTPPPPTACTYTYGTWAACQSNGTQSRTVVSATPTGCTGTPVVNQTCTYTPPPPATCTYTYNAWGTCQSNSTQTRTVASSSPSGCTGTPALTQACVYTPPPPATCSYTYNAWGSCQSNNTQARTVASSTPAGCTGTPVLTQACTYVPPACTYTYNAWGACQSDSTQTRTVASSSPSGCTGTPVVTQACTYTPPVDGAALYGQKCAGCHGALASSNLKGKGISLSSVKSAGMTQGLTDVQVQAVVTAVGP
jgi:hypothetical protein